MQKIGIVGVPSSAGARKTGEEQAPRAYRQANLIERLHSAGLSVTDFGDLSETLFRPDGQHPNAQNLRQRNGYQKMKRKRNCGYYP